MEIKVSKHKLKIHCRGSPWGSRTQQRAYCSRYTHSQHIESHLGKKQPQGKLCRQILDKIFTSSRHKFLPSRPLLISPIYRVNSSSCQVISLSRRVISSCRLYYWGLYEPERDAVWKHRNREGPGARTPSRAREKQSYGCERDDDSGRAVQIL